MIRSGRGCLRDRYVSAQFLALTLLTLFVSVAHKNLPVLGLTFLQGLQRGCSLKTLRLQEGRALFAQDLLDKILQEGRFYIGYIHHRKSSEVAEPVLDGSLSNSFQHLHVAVESLGHPVFIFGLPISSTGCIGFHSGYCWLGRRGSYTGDGSFDPNGLDWLAHGGSRRESREVGHRRLFLGDRRKRRSGTGRTAYRLHSTKEKASGQLFLLLRERYSRRIGFPDQRLRSLRPAFRLRG